MYVEESMLPTLGATHMPFHDFTTTPSISYWLLLILMYLDSRNILCILVVADLDVSRRILCIFYV
jgi:hypothetical protein